MEKDKIYQGDCLERLKLLPDECVDCCITSPPYFGLRDYGTAEWIGGNPQCSHSGQPMRTRAKINQNCNTGNDEKNATVYEPFGKVCGICGAVRVDKQIGLEETPQAYIERLTTVFREIRRVLKPRGTLWIIIGDSYAGSGKGAWKKKITQKEVYIPTPGDSVSRMPNKWTNIRPKNLIGIPWTLAFALREDGWFLRQDIVWNKKNPMPESVTDRCTKSHEYIFLLSKSAKYYYDYISIRQPSKIKENRPSGIVRNREYKYNSKPNLNPRAYLMNNLPNPTKAKRNDTYQKTISDSMVNKRDVWTVATRPFREAHFAVFPEALITDCVKAGCPEGGIVLDPFMGAGTTGLVAKKQGRHYIGIELNIQYVELANKRVK